MFKSSISLTSFHIVYFAIHELSSRPLVDYRAPEPSAAQRWLLWAPTADAAFHISFNIIHFAAHFPRLFARHWYSARSDRYLWLFRDMSAIALFVCLPAHFPLPLPHRWVRLLRHIFIFIRLRASFTLLPAIHSLFTPVIYHIAHSCHFRLRHIDVPDVFHCLVCLFVICLFADIVLHFSSPTLFHNKFSSFVCLPFSSVLLSFHLLLLVSIFIVIFLLSCLLHSSETFLWDAHHSFIHHRDGLVFSCPPLLLIHVSYSYLCEVCVCALLFMIIYIFHIFIYIHYLPSSSYLHFTSSPHIVILPFPPTAITHTFVFIVCFIAPFHNTSVIRHTFLSLPYSAFYFSASPYFVILY